jgi:hypothetical protein
MEQFLAAQT